MTEHNVTEAMLVAISILCLILGPFVQRMWNRCDTLRQLPELPEQLRAAAISSWLNEGVRKRLLYAKGIDDVPELIVDDLKLKDLDDWLKSPKFTIKGGALAAGERERLDSLFWAVFTYLIALGTAAPIAIILELRLQPDNRLAICIWGGVFGGCIAAFRSCLDRRANGFEDKDGNRWPEPEARKERFSDGMVQWFIGRPILSASVGLLLYFALEGDVLPEALAREVSRTNWSLLFYTCLAGLLAKTLLDLFLEAGKKIFRVEKE